MWFSLEFIHSSHASSELDIVDGVQSLAFALRAVADGPDLTGTSDLDVIAQFLASGELQRIVEAAENSKKHKEEGDDQDDDDNEEEEEDKEEDAEAVAGADPN